MISLDIFTRSTNFNSHLPGEMESDLLLQLSDASSLSSDSELMDAGSHGARDMNRRNQKISLRLSKGSTSKSTKHASTENSSTWQTSGTMKKTLSKGRGRSLSKASKQTKDQYCICRQGYDGKEFMVACDTCQEWFHGRCVGLSPKTVREHYFCGTCIKRGKGPQSGNEVSRKASNGNGNKGSTTKTKKQKSARKKANTAAGLPPIVIKVPTPAAVQVDDNDDDLDDICPVCDSECTCGISAGEGKLANKKLVSQLSAQGETKAEIESKAQVQHQEESSIKNSKKQKKRRPANRKDGISDEEVNVDVDEVSVMITSEAEASQSDSDDGESDNVNYSSDSHIDSGDDENLEEEEERALIYDAENGLDSDKESSDEDNLSDYGDIDSSHQTDDEDEEYEAEYYNNTEQGWHSSDDNEDEEFEFEDSFHISSGRRASIRETTPMVQSLIDEGSNLFDNIAAAFLHVLEPLTSTSLNGNDLLDDALRTGPSAKGKLPAIDRQRRRSSLPSSAVSAANQHRQATAELTPDALSAMSLFASEVPLPLLSTKEVEEPVVKNKKVITPSSPKPVSSRSDPISSLRIDTRLQEELVALLKSSTPSSKLSIDEISLADTTTTTSKVKSNSESASSSSSQPTHQHGDLPSVSTYSAVLVDTQFPNDDETLDIATLLDDNPLHNVRKKRRLSDIGSRQVATAVLTSSPPASATIPTTSFWADDGDEPAVALAAMDELVDTSQLFDRSSSSQSPPPVDEDTDTRFSSDLSRWQRVPIGAFRLMRGKNRFWVDQ